MSKISPGFDLPLEKGKFKDAGYTLGALRLDSAVMGLDYRFQIVNPSPVPSVWLLLPVGRVENLSKIPTRSSSGTLTPWSFIDTVTGVGYEFQTRKKNEAVNRYISYNFFA